MPDQASEREMASRKSAGAGRGKVVAPAGKPRERRCCAETVRKGDLQVLTDRSGIRERNSPPSTPSANPPEAQQPVQGRRRPPEPASGNRTSALVRCERVVLPQPHDLTSLAPSPASTRSKQLLPTQTALKGCQEEWATATPLLDPPLLVDARLLLPLDLTTATATATDEAGTTTDVTTTGTGTAGEAGLRRTTGRPTRRRGTQEQEGTEAGPVASETTPLAPLARRNRSPINAHSFQEGEERWSTASAAAGESTLNGVVLKYAEPPEARKPVRNWRLYVFKGKEQVELFHVHRQSAYLIGRDRVTLIGASGTHAQVADIPVDHPSTSKQHAVLQFRQVVERNEFGDTKSLTKPFIIDLDSANGTMVNDETIPASRYYELRSGDVLKFAFSTREYVLLAEAAQT
uniref:FHA domain-containing protein n=1 Tax=Rhodotorula toruloides TaxID=5286 RepID=A0A0K3CNP4_RHOTO